MNLSKLAANLKTLGFFSNLKKPVSKTLKGGAADVAKNVNAENNPPPAPSTVVETPTAVKSPVAEKTQKLLKTSSFNKFMKVALFNLPGPGETVPAMQIGREAKSPKKRVPLGTVVGAGNLQGTMSSRGHSTPAVKRQKPGGLAKAHQKAKSEQQLEKGKKSVTGALAEKLRRAMSTGKRTAEQAGLSPGAGAAGAAAGGLAGAGLGAALKKTVRTGPAGLLAGKARSPKRILGAAALGALLGGGTGLAAPHLSKLTE